MSKVLCEIPFVNNMSKRKVGDMSAGVKGVIEDDYADEWIDDYDDDEEDDDPSKILGEYRITQTKLGAGQYGDVYVGKHRETREAVAVKIFKKFALIKEGLMIDVVREVKLLVEFRSAGSHKNIVSLLEFRQHDGNLATVMDFCFTDLDKVIKNTGNDNLGDRDIKCYTHQLLCGLEWLHKSWCLHRDLKPENLLISPAGVLKISDFGLATQFASARPQRREEVVTITYRCPELLFAQTEPLPKVNGKKIRVRRVEMGPCIDIWSTGCILGEMMQRKPLFPPVADNAEMQLEIIFQLCGTPTQENWQNHQLVPGFVEFDEQPKNYLREW